ncbi:MAG: MBL fold metallo-hydrolase [Rubrivivax sp.]
MLVFRQLLDPASSTYTYLLGDAEGGEAVLIDPVFEQARRDLALLRELDLRLTATVDTHVHADHVTAAWLLKQRSSGCRTMVAAASGAEGADVALRHADRVPFGRHELQVRATPGHTDGCLSLVLGDERMAFTGDALLIRGCGRTDFQQGDPRTLFCSVHDQLLTLPAGCLLYPAHDYRGLTVTSVGEERRYNPRFGGDIAEADFVGYMNHLGLPHPKQMDVAVPANLRCGRPADGVALPAEPSWAPLTWTFAGLWEIDPTTLEERLHDVLVLDVREPTEYHGALGHVPGAQLLPLGDLPARAAAFVGGPPVVTVCRSGARSAQAAQLLERAGVAEVANLAGGMLRWRASGHPVDGGSG